jgi:hypothetical protein
VVERHYPPDTAELAAVRSFVRSAIAEREPDGADGADEAPFSEFVATELATNAIVHADSAFVVRIGFTPSLVRIEVSDDSDDAPVLARHHPAIHGLDFVDRLVHDWGYVVNDDGGKTVWAEVARRSAP